MVRIMLAVVVGLCLFPYLLSGQEAAGDPRPIRVYLSVSGPEGFGTAIQTHVRGDSPEHSQR